MEMTKRLIENAINAGAQCMATPCALCHLNLDVMQPKIEKNFNIKLGLPVLFFTQLIGLSLGIKSKNLGLENHMISPIKLFQ
jgi:heterodisulfide reductase subunit B